MTTFEWQPVIECVGVSKSFTRTAGRSLLGARIKGMFSKKAADDVFWALRDVSFSVQRGESVAIIGSNGAGKSTLLSIITGLCPPDRGTITVRGRVAALLQMGSGFHPDLSGAENLRLNASVIGMGRQRTQELFDRIVEFAELADFIGEPIRTYSTGMVMRLAFSISIHLDPDVLVVDEVLGVGDQEFQAKCYRKIETFREAGGTLLFVSHAAQVDTLCERALWIQKGKVMMYGDSREVSRAYASHDQAKVSMA